MTEPRKWVPVVVPGSNFDSRAEEVATEDATRDTPRLEGEDVNDWLEAVNAKAREILAARGRAYVDREPGEDLE